MTNQQAQKVSRKLRCLTCNTITNHQNNHVITNTFTSDEGYDPADEGTTPQYWEERTYRVWICAGCGSCRFEITVKECGQIPEEEVSHFYPEYNSSHKRAKQFTNVKGQIIDIYQEVILCFNHGAKIACAACLRTLLEAILADRGIKVEPKERNNLQSKINKLKTIPLVPETTVELLHSFRFMGNKALHQLVQPYEGELHFAIEAIEQLIYYIYEAKADLHEKLSILGTFSRIETDFNESGNDLTGND
jgi:hypothetical protein